MSAGYENAIRDPDNGLPHAQVCFDPFHVVQLGGKAADQVRRDEYNRHGRSSTGEGRWIKGTRYSLLKDTAKQTLKQLLKLAEVVLTNKRMYRAFLLYGELRYVYRLPTDEAPERLDAWLAWASRSRRKPFVKRARTTRKHKHGLLAPLKRGWSRVAQLDTDPGHRARPSASRATQDAEQRADRKACTEVEPRIELFPGPAVHPDLTAPAALPVSDLNRAPDPVQIALGQRQRF